MSNDKLEELTSTFKKTVTGQILLTEEQIKYYHKWFQSCLIGPTNLILRLLAFGYEGLKDDGLFEELSCEGLSKKDFTALCAEIRSSIVGSKSMTRGLCSSFFSTEIATPPKSAGKARNALIKLRKAGALPFSSGGLTSGDQFSVLANAIQRFRSFFECDVMTKANYAELIAKRSRVQNNEPEPNETEKERKKREELTPEERAKKVKALSKKIERTKNGATLTLWSETSLGSLLLGDNYVPYSLEQIGDKIILKVSGSSVISGVFEVSLGHGDNLVRDFALRYAPQESRKKKNLSAKSKFKGSHYELVYMENGKRLRRMILKEPRFHFKHSKHGLRAYLIMPLSGSVDMPIHLWSKKKACQFQRHYPKSFDGISSLRDFRVLGIDLGLNPAVAGTLFEAEGYRDGLPFGVEEIGYFAIERSECGDEYIALRCEFDALRKLMGHSKTMHTWLVMGKELDKKKTKGWEDSNIARFFPDVQSFKDHVLSLPEDRTQWNRMCFMVGGELRRLMKEFNQLKDQRMRVKHNVSDDLYWIELIDSVISTQKSFNCIADQPEDSREGFCSRLYAQRRSCRQDVRRKMCRKIIDYAISNECQCIAVEDLENDFGDKKSKDDNRLWSLWSPLMMITNLKKMAQADGVAVVQVKKEHTSQVVFGLGKFGYRDDDDKRFLYYETDDGTIKFVDADKNASRNIAHMAITRHAYPYVIKIETKDGRQTVKTKHAYGRMIKRMLKRHQFQAGVTWLFLHDGELLTWGELKALRKRIETRLSEGALAEQSSTVVVTA